MKKRYNFALREWLLFNSSYYWYWVAYEDWCCRVAWPSAIFYIGVDELDRGDIVDI